MFSLSPKGDTETPSGLVSFLLAHHLPVDFFRIFIVLCVKCIFWVTERMRKVGIAFPKIDLIEILEFTGLTIVVIITT